MTKFEALMDVARFLETQRETEAHGATVWGLEHEQSWELFGQVIEAEYAAGEITATEHDELALTAFYDYNDLKEEL